MSTLKGQFDVSSKYKVEGYFLNVLLLVMKSLRQIYFQDTFNQNPWYKPTLASQSSESGSEEVQVLAFPLI